MSTLRTKDEITDTLILYYQYQWILPKNYGNCEVAFLKILHSLKILQVIIGQLN